MDHQKSIQAEIQGIHDWCLGKTQICGIEKFGMIA